MSKPSKQTTKTKARPEANVAALVNSIASQNVPEYEKVLLQIRVFKEKKMYSTALQLFKKGMQIIQQQLQNNNDTELETKLNLTKSRYYHYASSVFYELNKYLKAISYSQQALNSCKGILDNSCIEIMRFKEVLASSYNAMEQYEDALTYYEPIYYSLNVQIETMQQNNIKKQQQQQEEPENNDSKDNEQEELKNDDNTLININSKKEDDSLKELNIWKADITYNIAMIYNHQQEFKKAAKYAKECCFIRNLYAPNTSKQILALMLVSVIVSCPQIAEYKLALDNLEKAKLIINTDKDSNELQQYLGKIQKLSGTVLMACVRWSKVTNSDLDHYLKTGQRRKQENDKK